MDYKCNVCVKDYSSYKSLWNHIKKYHKTKSAESQPKVSVKSAESQPKVSVKIIIVNGM